MRITHQSTPFENLTPSNLTVPMHAFTVSKMQKQWTCKNRWRWTDQLTDDQSPIWPCRCGAPNMKIWKLGTQTLRQTICWFRKLLIQLGHISSKKGCTYPNSFSFKEQNSQPTSHGLSYSWNIIFTNIVHHYSHVFLAVLSSLKPEFIPISCLFFSQGLTYRFAAGRFMPLPFGPGTGAGSMYFSSSCWRKELRCCRRDWICCSRSEGAWPQQVRGFWASVTCEVAISICTVVKIIAKF